MSALFSTVVYLQYSAAYLGIVVWGEGLSSREFPTSGTHLAYLEVWDLLIILQSCAWSSLFCVFLYFDGLLAMVHL